MELHARTSRAGVRLVGLRLVGPQPRRKSLWRLKSRALGGTAFVRRVFDKLSRDLEISSKDSKLLGTVPAFDYCGVQGRALL